MNEIIKAELFKILNKFASVYFQMEFLGNENLPKDDDEGVLFVMNHTAFFGLEAYLFASHLVSIDDKFQLYTLVWERFLNGPLGKWFKSLNCINADIDTACDYLSKGNNLLIMPEGTDATDVRNRINRFHTGYLRIIKKTPRKIIPIGFHGVDETTPWLVTENKFIVKKMAEPLNIGMDYYVFPKFPIFRPLKIVFSIGKPIEISPDELATESDIQSKNLEVKEIISELMYQSEQHRERMINQSFANRILHKFLSGRHLKVL